MGCCPQGTPQDNRSWCLLRARCVMPGWPCSSYPSCLGKRGGSERGWGLPRVTQLLSSGAQVRQAGTWVPLLQGLHLAKPLEQQNTKKL